MGHLVLEISAKTTKIEPRIKVSMRPLAPQTSRIACLIFKLTHYPSPNRLQPLRPEYRLRFDSCVREASVAGVLTCDTSNTALQRGLQCPMAPILFRCPNTGSRVQAWIAEEGSAEE